MLQMLWRYEKEKMNWRKGRLKMFSPREEEIGEKLGSNGKRIMHCMMRHSINTHYK